MRPLKASAPIGVTALNKGLETRHAIVFTDEDPQDIHDIITRAQEAGIRFRVKAADLRFNYGSWSMNEAIIVFETDQDKAAFMLVM